MPLYRCINCETDSGNGFDFEAAKQECPRCGAEGKAFIQTLAVIHFDAPAKTKKGLPIKGRGMRCAACDPAIRPRPGQAIQVRMTGAPTAVTCGKCRATPAWKAEMEACGEPICPEELDRAASEFEFDFAGVAKVTNNGKLKEAKEG